MLYTNLDLGLIINCMRIWEKIVIASLMLKIIQYYLKLSLIVAIPVGIIIILSSNNIVKIF